MISGYFTAIICQVFWIAVIIVDAAQHCFWSLNTLKAGECKLYLELKSLK
jgi:hypothetical protein